MIQMDIYKFVPSRDIREYLKKIDYKFTTPEAAFVIWACPDATMDERFEAWQVIIDTLPDCSMEERINTNKIDSFHAFLWRYMELIKQDLSMFYDETDAVYSSKCLHYKTLSKTIIQRQEIAGRKREKKTDAVFDGNGRILHVESYGYHDDKYYERYAFEGMWFAFPTPFERGDILAKADKSFYRGMRGYEGLYDFGSTPFVLDELCTWGRREMFENGFPPDDYRAKNADHILDVLTKSADVTEMAAYGFRNIGGKKMRFRIDDYLALEYFDRNSYHGLSGADDNGYL